MEDTDTEDVSARGTIVAVFTFPVGDVHDVGIVTCKVEDDVSAPEPVEIVMPVGRPPPVARTGWGTGST